MARTGDEDNVEDEPQRRGLMIPASMGLRCQIPDDLEEFTVTASWGVYEPVPAEEGDRRRRYKRTPVEIPKTITVAELDAAKTKDFPLKDDVVLRVDRHDDPERGCRLIELALCNDRETPRKIPVNAWLYQTKLLVTAGEPDAFLPVCDPLLDAFEEEDDELGGSTSSTGTGWSSPSDGPARWTGRWPRASGARTAVWTTWLPMCETPQVTADEIDAMLDMTAAGEGNPRRASRRAQPDRGALRRLAGRRGRPGAQLPEHLRAEGLEAVAEARKVAEQLADGLEHLLTRRRSAALLPVHEPGDGRPARAESGRPAPRR